MQNPSILSPEFKEALTKELNTVMQVIQDYDEEENLYSFTDYLKYEVALLELLQK